MLLTCSVKTSRSNPDDLLKSPADVPVWERYIIGHKKMASQEAEQYQTVLRHIALFQRFGFESPVSDEAKFISGLVEQVDPLSLGAVSSKLCSITESNVYCRDATPCSSYQKRYMCIYG